MLILTVTTVVLLTIMPMARIMAFTLSPVVTVGTYSRGETHAASSRSSSYLLSSMMNENDSSSEIIRKFQSQKQQQQHSRREWFCTVASTATAGMTLLSPSSSVLALPELVVSESVCDPTVSVWKKDDERILYLLGTAHISEISAMLAANLVKETHPNAVFVELDLKRIGRIPPTQLQPPPQQKVLEGEEAAEDSLTAQQQQPKPTQVIIPRIAAMTTTQIAEAGADDDSAEFSQQPPSPPPPSGPKAWIQRKALNFASAAVGNALKGMYSNLNQAGFNPGEEFAAAIREGQNIGASIVLGDQDVEYTLKRLTQALAVTDMNKLLSPDAEFEKSMEELLPGGSSKMQPELRNYDDPAEFKRELAEYVEKLKSRDNVRKIMSQLNDVAPALVQVMLTERDTYMARGIDTLNQFDCMVAVMGIAHQDGVEKNLRDRGWKQMRPNCSRL